VRELQRPPAKEPPERFEDFYAAEYRSLFGLAYALSGDRWTAEDIVQEAFLAAHRSWERISAYERPDAWIRRVVANLSASSLRRRGVEMKALARIALRRSSAMPELSAATQEFWLAVRALPRRQAQAVALFYLEDRPIAEIADILDMAPGTVKKHLHDGRQTLARRLQLEEDEA
jgi:RNA polymerase sigma-70 factor (ECF subfamily)